MMKATRTRKEAAMVMIPEISLLEEEEAEIPMETVMVEMTGMIMEGEEAPGEIEEGAPVSMMKDSKEEKMMSEP